MLSYSENILKTLTGKTSLQDVSIEQLQQITNSYPYFASAQFLLSKKMLDDKLKGFENALQKTALHFDNNLLLHYNLTEEVNNDVKFLSQNESGKSGEDEINAFNDIVEDNVEETIADTNETTASTNSYTANDNQIDVKPFTESEPNVIHEENYSDNDTSEHEVEESTIDITKQAFKSDEKISNLLKEQAKAFEKPLDETELPTENIPHHRIDYFESQGIKLDPEKETSDKLGTQLKRFTDWLKQMKRINPTLTNIETDIAGEIQAQNMAARSNDSKEVLTETMAEVLIRQGRPEEAVNIYEKLSFSNPSKSAYFAAKIAELKA